MLKINLYRQKTYRVCIIDGCSNFGCCKSGLCNTHSYRKKKGLDMHLPDLRVGVYNHRWREGISEYPNPTLLKKNSKIVLKKSSICQKCRKEPSRHSHHLDFGKTNHDLENLEALCISCHFKEHKYHYLYTRFLDTDQLFDIIYEI